MTHLLPTLIWLAIGSPADLPAVLYCTRSNLHYPVWLNAPDRVISLSTGALDGRCTEA
ncbi:hypothetical protein IQ268_28090 [Oculatella sp. LEGE 06141]|uniref:hypothetical protein n=1 Tax=Oculatella sp. LEGE 06141 TaxID=1828648 RepID=UPI00188050B5|nr:hypothetical protein [Oculatella sp. LEGE 06141]MBE9182413.1 hypothetical protein [Oculatella sp. LEGE 06141]